MVVLFPFIPLVLGSVSSGWRFGEILPSNYSMDGYEYVLKNRSTWVGMGYNLSIAYTVAVINLFLAIPAARFLFRKKSRFKGIYMVILFAPLIIPSLSSVLGIHYSMIIYGLTDNLLGVILVNIIPSFPYVLLSLYGSFKGFPKRLEESALIDGVSKFQMYRYIILPILLPGILIGSTISILISLSEYILTLLIGGGEIITLPILMFPYLSSGDKVVGAVYAILFILFNVIGILVFELGIRFGLKKITKVR
ncbi:ABC transporter permease subunit [Fusobacteria bacterium ZRK30]|nr:ABC transporter permease subunit [Fusobacteria bacterium ZRK30]